MKPLLGRDNKNWCYNIVDWSPILSKQLFLWRLEKRDLINKMGEKNPQEGNSMC